MIDYEKMCDLFPVKLKREIGKILKATAQAPYEIHIVRGSGSSIRFPRGRIYIGVSIDSGDIAEMMSLITGGALYAHRHTIKEGYVALFDGVRVGICGQARYERGELVGVSDVTSMLIRLPSYQCAFSDELLSAFGQTDRGMLIFAPAAGGKTTALRALIGRLARSDNPPRISVIDERCEFDSDEFSALDVDVFRGYERGEGMRIALRVMSPEILAIDEIGACPESREMLESVFGGVKFIATAHGRSYSDLEKRTNLKVFLEAGVFDTFVRIFNTDGIFKCEITRKGVEK